MGSLGTWTMVIALIGTAMAVGTSCVPGSLWPNVGKSTLTVAVPTFGEEVLDPSLDDQAGQIYYGHMFDRLLGANPDGTLSTALGVLEGWTGSDDGSSYTLSLKKGLKWHDGVEITSDDLVFSLVHYSRLTLACATCGSVYKDVREIQPLDRYRVQVTLKEPDAMFMTRLGPKVEDVPLLPRRYFEEGGGAGFTEEPIGSGPWRFSGRVPGESIEFEANQDYWNGDRVPDFDRLRLVQTPDPDVRVAMLRSGEVDMAPVELRHIDALKEEGFTIQGPRYVIETALRFFMSYDPAYLTAKPEFRKALILGMDRESIVARIYPPEAATLAGGSAMFGPVTEGHDPELPPYPYDPELARELLQGMGYNGETVHLISIPVYGLQETALINEMIVDDWRRIGVNVTIVPTDYGRVKARYWQRPQEFDDMFPAPVWLGGHVNRPGGIVNAISRYLTSSRDSLLSYQDPEKGDRIHAELLALTDGAARNERLRQLNRELYEEYWAAPIVWRHDVWALRPGLSGWQPTDGAFSGLHLETVRPG